MGQTTDFIQALGALIGAPAAVFTAAMLYLQLRDRRSEWVPEFEADISLRRRGGLFDPAPNPLQKVNGSISIRAINLTSRYVVLERITIRSPVGLTLLDSDISVNSLDVATEIPPGATPYNFPIQAPLSLSGQEVSMTFTVSLKSRKSRAKHIVVKSIIT